MNKHYKVLLLGASFGTKNMGVGALTSGAIKCIKNRFPSSDVCLLDYGKHDLTYTLKLDGRELLVPLINLRFSKKIYLSNNIAVLILIALILKIIPSKKMRDSIISNNTCLKRVYEADLAVSIAGGDSFSDIYGLVRFLYVTLPQILVILSGKRLVLLPQTLGPFNGKLPQIIARYIMESAEAVYSRDYNGMIEARELLGIRGRSDKVRFGYDVGFILEPIKPERLSIEGGITAGSTVGLNISGLLYIGGYTRNNMFGLKTDYRKLTADIIDFLINKKGASVVLIPHVFGGPTHLESDVNASLDVYRELKDRYNGKLSLVKGEYDQNEIKYIIGLCDFFIGSRMHACIAALSQNIPSVSIAYSKKFLGVMESIGVEDCVADPLRMGKDGILNVIDRVYEGRASIRERLKSNISEAKKSALSLLDGVEDPRVKPQWISDM
ncbi:MAG: polysaccharide pyruvyl transferase family protein [Deltaproteobacteria bacterium]|nr:polysaccharide pyruvyl transferase family protein [Deltaproteobacteria bacterium]